MNRIIVLIAVFCVLTCKAQLTIMQYPLQGLELKPSDIFKADIQNFEAQTNQLYFTGSIVNTLTGEKVVTAKTSFIEIPPGFKTLSEAALAPQYVITSDVVNQTGVLPYGNYRICLKAYKTNGIEEVVSACQEIEVTPLSPPLLLSPEHQSSVTEPYPLLVWLPPMPLGKTKLVYDLKLVELLPNQTPYDAIQRNFAVLETFNINGTTLQYPANALKLEDGKKYAWKVAVKTTDRKPVGETEVWWFTKQILKPLDISDIKLNENYIIAKEERDNSTVFIGKSLKVVIEDYPIHIKLKFRIVDIKRNKDIDIEKVTYTEEGNGHYTIDLDEKVKLENGKYYLFVVSLPSNNSKYIYFKYIKK
jgi:hypothetical protein